MTPAVQLKSDCHSISSSQVVLFSYQEANEKQTKRNITANKKHKRNKHNKQHLEAEAGLNQSPI